MFLTTSYKVLHDLLASPGQKSSTFSISCCWWDCKLFLSSIPPQIYRRCSCLMPSLFLSHLFTHSFCLQCSVCSIEFMFVLLCRLDLSLCLPPLSKQTRVCQSPCSLQDKGQTSHLGTSCPLVPDPLHLGWLIILVYPRWLQL